VGSKKLKRRGDNG